jgi:arylsulfatase A
MLSSFANRLLQRGALFAACMMPLLSSNAAAQDRQSSPNIVIIFCDDLGYADIGPFGAKAYPTPNLDRMAKEGIKLTNFHVSQAVCSASRAALMTGCYNNRIGIHGALGPGAQVGINSSEMTMAELLKQKGYTTGIAGKWHLGDAKQFLPIHHGFDEYLGLPYSNDMWPYHPAQVNLTEQQKKKRKGYPPLPLIEGDQIIDPEVTAEDQTQLTTRYTERAVQFIKKNKDKPFFFYLPHAMVHVPLYVSDKFKGKSSAGLFGDVMMEVDWSVGEIMKALDESGISKDTLLIFTSDNGPWLSYGDHAGSAGPLREGKGTTWEGGVRVPFLARWPGKIPAGSECREPAMTIDLFATFAKLTGAPLPQHKIDGMDIWPLLSGDPKARSPQTAYRIYYAQNELQAIICGQWKLVLPHTYRSLGGKPGGAGGKPAPYVATKTELQLFDLFAEPGEKTDVAAKHPDVVVRLQGYAESAREDLGDSLMKRSGTGTREPGRISKN